MLKRFFAAVVLPAFVLLAVFHVAPGQAKQYAKTVLAMSFSNDSGLSEPVMPMSGIAGGATSVLRGGAQKKIVSLSKIAPRRLSIPRLRIDAPVEDVGTLPNGRMDVPYDGQKLGWFSPGPMPGQTGNAVIAGHLTTAKGPGAFWELNKMLVGDVFHVYDADGSRRDFRVLRTEVYDVRTAPIMEIFGPSDKKHLNLITCAGVWDRTLNHYDKRLIVYAELAENGAATVAVR